MLAACGFSRLSASLGEGFERLLSTADARNKMLGMNLIWIHKCRMLWYETKMGAFKIDLILDDSPPRDLKILCAPCISRNYDHINSLWPTDTIWQHRSRSTLAQVMACCLTAPSHYLNQCWLIISKMLRHSPEGNFAGNAPNIYHWWLWKWLIKNYSNISQRPVS